MRVPGSSGNSDQGILRDMIDGVRLNDIFHIGDILKHESFMSSWRARELPKIDIGGTMFFLDLRLNEFREVENFANRIDLDELYETGTGELKLAFDKDTKNLFEGDREELALHKNVVVVTLPSQQKMDPLGFVWLMEEKGWLSKEDAALKTRILLEEYNIHKSGMILQHKSKEKPLLEKKIKQNNKPRGKRL